MNGPKVVNAAPGGREVDGASGYMLESLSIWWYSFAIRYKLFLGGWRAVKIRPAQIISREVQL